MIDMIMNLPFRQTTMKYFMKKMLWLINRTEKYLYRIVTSANQLVEKIQIFDDR